MRPFPRALLRTTTRTLQSSPRLAPVQLSRALQAPLTATTRRTFQTTSIMSAEKKDVGELKIENTNISQASGVELSSSQKTLVGSVLDLFAGRPSLAKLQLWTDDAEFIDPLTISKGRVQYEPQWYGLQVAFSEIERLHHSVTSAGNPIEMDLKTRYVVKGINQEKTIDSKIKIWTDDKGEKIVKLHDEWNGKLPESRIAKAFQRLNANSMPYFVSVPKNAEEDAKRGNQ